MNRLALMVLKNFWRVPGAYVKLCHYAKHTEEYSEEEKYRHIQYILKTAVKSGNIDLQVFGKENIPQENGFLMYANHQGLFSGSFKCATKAKCPILPVTFIDSYKPLDQKGSRRVTVQLHYLEPVYYEEYKALNTVELAKMVHSRIERTINEKVYVDAWN